MKASLERRLAELETSKQKHLIVRHIFLMPLGRDDDAITGFQHKDCIIRREAGETLVSLEARTAEAIGNDGIYLIRALLD
jgi:hypothetical protein